MKYFKQFLDPNTPASQVYGMFLHTENSDNNNFHTHNYCEIMLIISGRMLHKYNNKSTILYEKQLCFVRDSDVHSCSCHQSPLDFFNIGIPTELLKEAASYYDIDIYNLLNSSNPPVVSVGNDNFEALHKKIQAFMKTEYNELHGRMFKNLLSEMLFLLSTPDNSSIHTIYHSNTPKWFLDLLSEMDKVNNFTVGLTKLSEISQHSQEYINRCFKKYLNTTPTRYINLLRLNYAKKLIVEEDVNIITACYRSGFESESYFYKVFKNTFHCTPLQILKEKNKLV